MTVVGCEGGVITLISGGNCEFCRDGKMTPGLRIPYLPCLAQFNHRGGRGVATDCIHQFYQRIGAIGNVLV